MFLFYFSISLTILSSLLYHLAQKLTPQGAHPLVSLGVTYGAALLICLAALIFSPPRDGLLTELRRLNGSSLVLALAIFGLEIGFLLAYRAGWNISLAAILANVALGVLLIPVGLVFFREQLTPLNWVGLLLCVVGLFLVNRR